MGQDIMGRLLLIMGQGIMAHHLRHLIMGHLHRQDPMEAHSIMIQGQGAANCSMVGVVMCLKAHRVIQTLISMALGLGGDKELSK